MEPHRITDEIKRLSLPQRLILSSGHLGFNCSGKRQIRVYHEFHLRFRARATASLMSLLLSPADLAWLRAFAMIASNSVMDGGVIALRITTSLSPTTTNCIPECSLSRFRISPGMTPIACFYPIAHSPWPIAFFIPSPVVIAYYLFLRYLIQIK